MGLAKSRGVVVYCCYGDDSMEIKLSRLNIFCYAILAISFWSRDVPLRTRYREAQHEAGGMGVSSDAPLPPMGWACCVVSYRKVAIRGPKVAWSSRCLVRLPEYVSRTEAIVINGSVTTGRYSP